MKWCPSVTEQSEGPMDTVASSSFIAGLCSTILQEKRTTGSEMRPLEGDIAKRGEASNNAMRCKAMQREMGAKGSKTKQRK